MTGLTLQTMIAEYERIFLEYLFLINQYGTISGTGSDAIRTLPEANATTNTAGAAVTDSITDANSCWTQCTGDCIVSVFNTSTNSCSLYNTPTDDRISYVGNANTTSIMSNDNYFKYNILQLNSVLSTYISNIEQQISSSSSDYTKEQLMAINILASTLISHKEILDRDRSWLTTQLAKLDGTAQSYEDTYIETTSNHQTLYLWIVVAIFAIIVALFMCYTIIKRREEE